MESISFDHIHLISDDPDAAAKWYESVLDGSIEARYEFRGTVQLKVVIYGISLLIRGVRSEENGEDWPAMQHYSDFSSHGRKGVDHFGLRTGADLEETCQLLRDKGAEFAVEPWEFSPGLWVSYLSAPDGVTIELFSVTR